MDSKAASAKQTRPGSRKSSVSSSSAALKRKSQHSYSAKPVAKEAELTERETKSILKNGGGTAAGTSRRSSRNWIDLDLFPDPEPNAAGPSTSGHSIAKKAIIAVALLLICGVLLTIGIWALSFPSVTFCDTSDCLRHVTELKEAMDTSVDPCNDFYKFTCGSWKPKQKERSMIARVFDESTDRAISEMEGSREKTIAPKAVDYFKSCIQPRDFTPDDLRVYFNFKEQIGLLWPEKNQTAIDALLPLLNLTINWNINLLFHVHALPAYKRRPQTLNIRRGIVSTSWLDPTWTAATFAEAVRQHCALLRIDPPPPSSIQELKITVEDIVDAAVKVPPDATSDTQFALREIEVLMPKRSDEWLSNVNKLHSPQFKWTLDSPVALEDDAILQNVHALLHKYKEKKQTLMEGFSFVFLRISLWLLAGKPELRYGPDAELGRNIWKRTCLIDTTGHFGLLVAAKHIYARYNSSVRSELERFHQSIQATMKQQLEDAYWIEAPVRSRAVSKIEELSLDAIPEENFFSKVNLFQLYRDFPNIGASFIRNYIAVAAAYRRLIGHDSYISVYSRQLGEGAPSRYNYYYNIAYMALGAMEPPILYLHGTEAMMHGSFGTLIAGCMVRSFDRRGVLFNDLGRREKWWDSPAYTERISCDLLSGSKYDGGGTGQSPKANPIGGRDPREVRFSSLFPLAPGLTVSFMAHRAAVAKKVRYLQHRLRGFEDYTDDQLFFLTYCLMTCATNSSGEECNVPVRQTQAFADAYQCPSESPMNPSKKCTFF
ncbi:neprilysin-1-like [Dermacentor albipictus]|uniref:neprilysin-1-like n=1 Tax=Dermacentor albipictus TaxID=60249 RepID=UPI0031FDFA5A